MEGFVARRGVGDHRLHDLLVVGEALGLGRRRVSGETDEKITPLSELTAEQVDVALMLTEKSTTVSDGIQEVVLRRAARHEWGVPGETLYVRVELGPKGPKTRTDWAAHRWLDVAGSKRRTKRKKLGGWKGGEEEKEKKTLRTRRAR